MHVQHTLVPSFIAASGISFVVASAWFFVAALHPQLIAGSIVQTAPLPSATSSQALLDIQVADLQSRVESALNISEKRGSVTLDDPTTKSTADPAVTLASLKNELQNTITTLSKNLDKQKVDYILQCKNKPVSSDAHSS